MPTTGSESPHALRDVVGVMLKLGTIAFGGPAVHVAMLREEAVRRRHWLADEEFADLFGAVSLLPGPSSTQLAIVLSRRRAGWAGLVLGGACFIVPAMAIVVALAWGYTRFRGTLPGRGLLYGIEPMVVALVAVAIIELGRTALKRWWLALIGVGAVAGYLAGANVLLVLVSAALIAVLIENRGRLRPETGSLVLVAAPLMSRGTRPRLTSIAAEFAKLGVVVFGSGYVLFAFLRRDLVTDLGWLPLRAVLDAVAAGQLTPGPVFTTATFIGFLLRGVPGAIVATAAIFVPSFVMVAALEPVVRRVRRSPWFAAAFDGVVVAALGLMAGVAFDLARRAVVDPLSGALAAGAFLVLLKWRPNAVWIILAGGLVGVVRMLA